MVFKPVQCRVNIGGKYYSNAQGFLYCWETMLGDTNSWAKDIDDFSQLMRLLNITPNQINNAGTRMPYPTDPLNERKLEYILNALRIPAIRVLKKYLPTKEDESELKLTHPYAIEMRGKSIDCKLKEIPHLLENLGCKKKDVLFHKELSEQGSYDNLNIEDRIYIELHTIFRDE